MLLEYNANGGYCMAKEIDILVEPGKAPYPAKVEDT